MNDIFSKIKKLILIIFPPIFITFYYKINVFFHKHECKVFEKLNGGTAIVIGNGPSLTETIKKHLDIITNNDCFMINQSVTTQYYELIKPKYYVLMDPHYTLNDSNDKYIKTFIENFIEKTKWEINIFVPYYWHNCYLVNELKNNSLVHVIYTNSTLCDFNYLSKKYMFKNWARNTMYPLAQTVMNAAVSLAISMKYDRVLIVGADTSWIDDYEVDQQTNDLYTLDKHYYGDDRRIIAKYNPHISNMSTELSAVKKVFDSYQLLKEYAEYSNVKLFNASEFSYIDCIDRIKL